MVEATAAPLRRFRARATPAQTFLAVVGAALVGSGLVHLGVFLVDGGPWHGPLSWRKPVTFGLSFGITAVAVAVVASFLPLGRRLGWLLLGSFGIASALEVAWVSVQRWRGVPSHFAREGVDALLFAGAAVTIGVIGLVLLAVTVLAFRRLEAPPSMAVAIRVGLVLLLVGQVLGGAIVANGTAIDVPPTDADLAVFGAAGAMKVPHAVALHAVQVLPLLAWLASLTTMDERQRTRVVTLAAGGYVSLVAASAVQTFSGRAPLEATWPGTALATLGALTLVAVWVLTLGRLRPRARVRPAIGEAG